MCSPSSFWQVVLPQISQSPIPIVVERFIRDDAGNGETMRVRSAGRNQRRAGDFFDVPSGYEPQDLTASRKDHRDHRRTRREAEDDAGQCAG